MTSEPDSSGGSPASITEVDERAELDSVIEENEIVLVEFYADWCGPCKMMEPILEALSRELDVCVVTVDTEANPGIAADADVRGLPTFLVYDSGTEIDRYLGVTESETLRSALVR